MIYSLWFVIFLPLVVRLESQLCYKTTKTELPCHYKHGLSFGSICNQYIKHLCYCSRHEYRLRFPCGNHTTLSRPSCSIYRCEDNCSWRSWSQCCTGYKFRSRYCPCPTMKLWFYAGVVYGDQLNYNHTSKLCVHTKQCSKLDCTEVPHGSLKPNHFSADGIGAVIVGIIALVIVITVGACIYRCMKSKIRQERTAGAINIHGHNPCRPPVNHPPRSAVMSVTSGNLNPVFELDQPPSYHNVISAPKPPSYDEALRNNLASVPVTPSPVYEVPNNTASAPPATSA